MGILNKNELKEPMMETWGRIIASVRNYNPDQRLKALVEKFNKDMTSAKIEEGYFKKYE